MATSKKEESRKPRPQEKPDASSGMPGPGRGNQDFGPQGATPEGVGPVDHPDSRSGPDDSHREDPDPDQGWGRGGALKRDD